MAKITNMADGSKKIDLKRGCRSNDAYDGRYQEEWNKGPERWTESFFLYKGCLYNAAGRGCEKHKGDYLYDVSSMSLEMLVAKLEDRELYDYRKSDSKSRRYGWIPQGERIPLKRDLGLEFEGKSVILVMQEYKKMTYTEILQLLELDHATVDADGIVRRR